MITKGKADVKYTDGTVDEGLPAGIGAGSKIRPIGTGDAVGGVLFLDEACEFAVGKASR